MKLQFWPLLLYFSLLIVGRAGDMASFDIQTDFNNVGYMKELTFRFIPENFVTKYDYFKVVFPAGISFGSVTPESFAGYWSVKSASCDTDSFPITQTLTATVVGSIVVLEHFSNGERVPFTPGLLYTFKFISPNGVIATEGRYDPVLAYLAPKTSDIAG